MESMHMLNNIAAKTTKTQQLLYYISNRSISVLWIKIFFRIYKILRKLLHNSLLNWFYHPFILKYSYKTKK